MLVVPDSGGRLRNWTHARAQPWYGRIVVLVGERTPTEYLDHLDRRGIEHLTAGEERVDLRSCAASSCGRTHAVRSIRTDSGGALNGALLAAGLVDRVAVIIAPRIGSDPAAQTLIRLPGSRGRRLALRLVESEVLDDGALWLVYDGCRPEPCTNLPAWPLPRRRRRRGGPPSCPAPGRSGTTNVPGSAAI